MGGGRASASGATGGKGWASNIRVDPAGPIFFFRRRPGWPAFEGVGGGGRCVSGPGCTGTAGQFCPPNGGGGGLPGGQGAGTIPNHVIPINTTKLCATAFGVCGGIANEFQLPGAGGGACSP